MSDSRTPATQESKPVALRPVDRFRASMRERAARTGDDPGAIMAQQVDSILTAETAEDIWNADAGGTVQAQDAVGMEVEIRSLTVVPSDKFEGSEYYGSMDVVCLGGPAELLTRTGLEVGDNFVLQTGAEKILAKVRAFEAKDLLPVQAVIFGATTRKGYDVLSLRPVPVRSMPAPR